MKLKILSTEIILVYKLAQLKVREMISSLRLKAYESNNPTNAGDVEVLSRANVMEDMLIKKLRSVSLKANQL
jgi:hypothetical protein